MSVLCYASGYVCVSCVNQHESCIQDIETQSQAKTGEKYWHCVCGDLQNNIYFFEQGICQSQLSQVQRALDKSVSQINNVNVTSVLGDTIARK